MYKLSVLIPILHYTDCSFDVLEGNIPADAIKNKKKSTNQYTVLKL